MKRIIPQIVLSLITILKASIVDAGESLLFKQISTSDGLSQNTVRCIHVDRRGFVWAGTFDGLNRYDGSRFIIYKPRIGENSLSDHRIRNLHEDKNGFLWVRKYDNSYSCYNPKTETFINLLYKNTSIPLSFTNYIETTNGAIWLWDSRKGCIKITNNKTGLPEIEFISTPEINNISHSGVEFVFEDSQKNVWIGTQNGLNIVTQNNEVETFYKDHKTRVFRKCIEIDGIIYFITDQNNIFRYNLLQKTFLQVIGTDNSCQFLDLVKLNRKELLLTTRSHGLYSFDIKTGTFNNNPFPHNSKIGKSAQVLTDNELGVWIYDHTGVLRHYNQQTGKLRELHLIPKHIASVIDLERYIVYIDAEGSYWITTYGNGLFKYDPVTGNLENFKYNTQTNSPASDYLLSITEDQSGNLWIGSEYAGIVKVVKQNYKIRYIRPETENILGSSNNVKVIFEDSKQNVWVGTKNGSLYLYDKDLKNSRCVRKNLNPYTIMEDHKNRIWIGTKGNGIYIFDLSGINEINHFVNDENDPESLVHNSVFNILQDNNKRIWVGTFGGGLNLVTESHGKTSFKHFLKDQGNKSYIRYLYQDRYNRIWAGSYEGLICFKPDEFINNSEKYIIYIYDPKNIDGLNCNDIKTIFEDNYNQLWIGTAGGGLNLFVEESKNGINGRFIKYTTQQGLPSDVVTAILESKDSILWISTENGITRFGNTDKTFMTYYFSERTFGNHYNENACALRKNGEMLWGTLDGLIAFDPEKFIKDNQVPPVILTDLFIYDQRIETKHVNSPLKESITLVNLIKLNHKQNTFTIHFSSLNLTDPKMNKYSYIMEPFDKYWSLPGYYNEATYKNLPPGTYTFKVKGSNADGKWNSTATEIKVIVTPPFWKSNFAIGIYIVVVLLLLGLTFMVIFKISNLNNIVRVEKQLTDYKLRFFTNISHEFRTPLTLIKGAVESLWDNNEIPESSRKQVEVLNRNTKQMTRLIDQLLEFRKIQNNVLTLNLELTELSEYMGAIFNSFSEIAIQKNIKYSYKITPDKWELYIDHNKLEKIVYNLLSNAFKFTQTGGSIELKVEKNNENHNCLISVTDNGIGVPKEKQHLLFSRFMQANFSSEGTGVGLSLVKEFTETHKGTVWFEENPSGGSIFRVEIPGLANAYKDVNFVSNQLGHTDHLIQDDIENPWENQPDSIKNSLDTPHDWNILIIDDNQDIRDYLNEELGKHFNTETAGNGKIGLEMALSNNPDLIISDVKMPEMDGFEVTSTLKSDFQTSHIPIILLTAFVSEDLKLKGSDLGADAYIMKPFSLKYLISRVYKLIEQREMLKKRFSVDINTKENLLSNTGKDKEFYLRINNIIEDNIDNPNFSIDEFTELSGQRRTIFFKKIKGLTGYSPNELLKIKRMKKAAELLLQGNHTVAEVSWKVGIEDQFYFSKCFKAQFGCSPSKYADLQNNKRLSVN